MFVVVICDSRWVRNGSLVVGSIGLGVDSVNGCSWVFLLLIRIIVLIW